MSESRKKSSRRETMPDVAKLLVVRQDLSREVYEQLSHGVDGAWDLVEQLLALERHVEVVAPAHYRRRSPGWARDEARLLHVPGTRSDVTAGCSRCRASAESVESAA